MINGIIRNLFKFVGSSVAKETAKNVAQKAVRSGAHKKAISDGLRRGSSEAAKIMAKWRWK